MAPEEQVREYIIRRVSSDKLPFLLQESHDRASLKRNLALPIEIDDLDVEERLLVLSVLPSRTQRVFLRPLDKGLSGAQVLAMSYVRNDNRSKRFVVKIGSKRKAEREFRAICNHVAGHIDCVGAPVLRLGPTKGLLLQDFAGLGARSHLRSLREATPHETSIRDVLLRFFRNRLGNWYTENRRSQRSFNLGDLFEMYLAKAPSRIMIPAGWSGLREMVRENCGRFVRRPAAVISKVKKHSISSAATTIHGDLHSLNILVDDANNCWPIDFAWCRSESSPVLDMTMLECSLKFLVMPWNTDLRGLLGIEHAYLTENYALRVGDLPYSDEIRRVLKCVQAIRRFAKEEFGINWEDYRRALLLMTFVHASHKKLNLAYLLGSLFMQLAIESGKVGEVE